MNGPARQQGIALFVSLMFMVILTIIGVASVRTSTLDLRLAQNFQFRTIAFQFAETAIVRVMGNADMEAITNPDYDADTDKLLEAIRAGVGSTSVLDSIDDSSLHPGNTSILENVTVTAETRIVYTQGAPCPGGSFGILTCYEFEVQANTAIRTDGGDILTRTRHIQGLRRTAPTAS